MKKTGKILFGVLSVSALVGTGFAAWIVNNGFTDKKEVTVDPSVDTEIQNKYDTVTLTVNEKDTALKFAPKDEDLSVSFNLKGKDTDYDLAKYNNLSDDYIPDVTITTEILKKAQTRAEDPELEAFINDVKEFVILPETTTVPYTTWLEETNKESGYDVNLTFKWNTEGNINPQEAWGNLPDANEKFTKLVNTLKQVQFKFTFTVGRLANMQTLTLNEVNNGKVTLEDSNGNALTSGSSYREGTLVTVKTTSDPYYKLATLQVNGVDLVSPYTFTLDNNHNTVSATFTNKVINFEINNPEVGGTATLLNEENLAIEGTTLTSGSKFKVKENLNEGYGVEKITVLQGEEELIADESGLYTTLDNEDKIVVTLAVKVTAKAKLTYSEVQGVVTPTFIDYTLGTELTKGATIVMNKLTLEENYRLVAVKVNGQEVNAETNGTYKLVLTNENENVLTIEVKETRKVTVIENPNATITLTSNEEIVNSDDSLDLGSEVVINVEPKEGFILSEVLVNNNPISILEGTYKFIIESDEGYVVSCEVIEKITSSSEILELDEGTTVKAKGKVLTIDKQGFTILDKTGYVYVFDIKANQVNIGDVVVVQGVVGNYNNRNQIQNVNSVTKVDETIVTKTYEKEGLTYDMLQDLCTTPREGLVEFSFKATSTNKGVLVGGSEYGVSFSNSATTFESGKFYNIEAYICGYYQKNVNLTIVSSNDITAPESIQVNLTEGETNLSVNGVLDFNTKYVATPAIYVGTNVTVEVVGANDGVVEATGSTVKALKAGTVQVKVVVDGVSSEVITLTVTQPTLTSLTLEEIGTIKANTPTDINLTCDPVDYVPAEVTYKFNLDGTDTGTAEVKEGKLVGLTVGTVTMQAQVGEILSNVITVTVEEAPAFVEKTDTLSLANLQNGVGSLLTQLAYNIGDFKVTSIKGSTDLREQGDETIRIYANAKLKIEFIEPLQTRTINKIVFTYDGSSKYQLPFNLFEAFDENGVKINATEITIGNISDGTCEVTSNKKISSITFVNNENKQLRIKEVTVTYTF